MQTHEIRTAQEEARRIINGRVAVIRAAGRSLKWSDAFAIADELMNGAHRNTIRHMLAGLIMTQTRRDDYNAKQQALEDSKARAAEQQAAREKEAAEQDAAKAAEIAPVPVKEEPKEEKKSWWKKLWK